MASIHNERRVLASGKTRTVYRVKYRDPEGRQKSKTFDRKADARQFEATVEADMIRGSYVDPHRGRVSFGDWAERYIASTVNMRANSTARDDSLLRNHVLPRWRHTPLAAIDHLDVRAWVVTLGLPKPEPDEPVVDGRHGAGLAPGSVHKVFQVLDKMLATAVDAKVLPANPCDRVPLPRIESEEARVVPPRMVLELADTMEPRYRALVLLAAIAGLRIGELAGLRVKRLDLMRGRVEVAEILTDVRGVVTFGPPKTRAGRRVIPITRDVCDELTTHLAAFSSPADPDALVFPGRDGGPLRPSLFRARQWKAATTAVGLSGLKPHELRHTAVSLWIMNGATPVEVARRAGHSRVQSVFQTYGHLFTDEADPLTDRMGSMFAAAQRARDEELSAPTLRVLPGA